MSYDANGNTLNDGMNSYVWDARNRLVSADNNGASFSYDPLGRRVSKSLTSSTTSFLYDGANPVQEQNGGSVAANLLTGGLDERFQRTDSTGAYSLLTDALGSTLALTNSTGTSQVQYSYSPFGSMSITGITTSSYGYTGRETDGLGIDYYRARYYNPTTGRFLSEDPIGFAGGINKYAYVGGDPIDFFDPFGLDKKKKPCNDKNNNRSRFFQQLPGLKAVAQQLDVPTDFIVGLSSYESGWFDDHNVALNNLWGLTQGGGNNIHFSSVAAGNAYFVNQVGPYLQGDQTIQDFFADLQKEGYN